MATTETEQPTTASAMEQDAADSDPAIPHVTRVFYITPHGNTKQAIKIHDLTNKLSRLEYSTEIEEEAEKLGQSLADETPLYTIVQPGWWKTITLYAGAAQAEGENTSEALITWKPSGAAHSKQSFNFPESSPFSSHDLTMRLTGSFFTRNEAFVKDSVQYLWRFDSKWQYKHTLYKKIGQSEMCVAKFRTPFRAYKTGGTIFVNEDEIDAVVATITSCAMLRKIRQRR